MQRIDTKERDTSQVYYSNACAVTVTGFFCLSAVIDARTFERLLSACKEIMKNNIAQYEERLVGLFGSSIDLRD